MKQPKVLDNNQVTWFKENSTRLNYNMIFDDGELLEQQIKEQQTKEKIRIEHEIRINEIISERDKKWKNKLKKVEKEAFKKGFEEGKAEGRSEALEELDTKVGEIARVVEAGHSEWKKRQELMDPGLLDIAFHISESILGIPVENPEMRKSLELSLGPIFERIDEESKPVLLVAESDFEFITSLKERFTNTFVRIKVDEQCLPGEFTFESTDEQVVHSCRNVLQEFRKSIPIPTWEKE